MVAKYALAWFSIGTPVPPAIYVISALNQLAIADDHGIRPGVNFLALGGAGRPPGREIDVVDDELHGAVAHDGIHAARMTAASGGLESISA